MNPLVKKSFIRPVFVLVGAVYLLGSVGSLFAHEHHEHHHVAEETGHISTAVENPDQLPVGMYAGHFYFLIQFPSSYRVFSLESTVQYGTVYVCSTRAPPLYG